MADARIKLVLYLLSVINLQFGWCLYQIPEVRIEVLKPKGLRASIPDNNGIALFAFQANINKAINQNDVGQIGYEVVQPEDGRWVVFDPDIELKDGDVIKYWVFVSADSLGFVKDGLSFTVGGGTSLGTMTQKPAVVNCETSQTIVRGTSPCAGEVIFQETFDTYLKESMWLIEQKIPSEHLEHPFVSYQRGTVSVEKGSLRIQPTPQQDMPGYGPDSDYLDLRQGCTGQTCEMHSSGPVIIPPVASGRIKSIGFTFKYGRIDIKAKLPRGDWLYPDIVLEPVWNKYGAYNYSSGLIKIAKAQGNNLYDANVNQDNIEYGNSVLEGSILLSNPCPGHLKYRKVLPNGKKWSDAYHTYSVIWTPDYIKFVVDGKDVRTFTPTDAGLSKLITDKRCQDNSKAYKTKIAPFDEEFVISLGVLVGGTAEFPEDAPNKPWKNTSPKAQLHFWQAMDSWLPTWTGKSALLVDSIRVTAL